MTYTFFLLLKARPEWLALPRDRRGILAADAFAASRLNEIGQVRHFDVEAFSTMASDLMMITTDNPGAYYFAMERLRDTPLLTVPYFDIVAILPAVENGFRQFEAAV
ncbi:hypothetical protein OU426_08230 [Frigidibacter sp. RF13]|uniref:darcynin family protein n=1 Tax=Frigidibacter sp. RF13 TaxID=2997340 RepID=UPI00226F7412|nr:darcynin family protein [Frigidibacter sp. RF13]MCY1126837.1 hypothetical protein [Frigidibacter sp. RF13]